MPRSNIQLGGQELKLDADADTSITVDTDDQIDIKIAGADDFRFTSNTFTILSGSTLVNSGNAIQSNAGITIDNITIDGTEIDLSSGSLTLDVQGNIILDNDGGSLQIMDGGTEYARIGKNGDAVDILNPISDGDIIFKGNDGGSTIIAMLIDMSAGGNVGIGTTTPPDFGSGFTSLQVNDSSSGIVQANNSTNSVTTEIEAEGTRGAVGTRTNHDFAIKTNQTERMRIDSNGQVQVNGNQTLLDSDTFFQVNVNGGNSDDGFIAIACNGSNVANQQAGIYLGRTNNRIMTTVDGNANFRDDIQIRAGGSGGVSLSSGATSFAGASDEKLKTIIENITGALDNVAELRTVIGRYEWDAEDKRRSFLIAQDVQAVLPEVVEKNPEGNLMLDYTGVIPLLTAALKEAKTKIETLEAKVTALEGS